MNWLFINPIKAQGWGGMENWMLKLCLGLRDHGDTALMVARPTSPWPEVCRTHGIRYAPFTFGGDLAPWAILRLRSIAAAFKPDVAMAKGFRQVRFVRAACPGITLAAKMPVIGELKDGLIDRVTYACGLDRVFVDSHAGRSVCLAHPWVQPGRIITVHNGVALPGPDARPAARERLDREFALAPGTVLIGAAGRLVPDKRYADLLAALAQAMPATNVCLVLFGEGPEQAALERQARHLGLADRVRFAGWRDGLRELLPGFDLFVHPSLTEGLPNVVLEAMAGGVPVIASNAGGTVEIVTVPDVGVLYPAGDVEALAGHMRRLLADPARRTCLGMNAAAHVAAHFSIPRMVTAVRDAMVAVAGARNALQVRPAIDAHGVGQVCRPAAAIPDLFAAAHAPDAVRVTESQRSSVVRLERRGLTVYLKQFRYDTRAAWRYAWRPPEALANFRTAQRLELAGVRVVPHLAAAWRGPRTRRESVLLTGTVPGTTDLAGIIADTATYANWRGQGLRDLATWLARLHAAGIAPHDLKAANLLWDARAPRDQRLVMLDLDNARIHRLRAASPHAAERNLHQCFRSFQPRLTRRDVLRFAACYRRTRRLPRGAFRRLLAVVEQRLHRRGTGYRELP